MRILLTMNVPYTRSSGGANRSNKALMEALLSRGHYSAVVSPALASPSLVSLEEWRAGLVARGVVLQTGEKSDRFGLAGVQVTAVNHQGQMRSALKDVISDFQPDWILVSSEDPSQSLLAVALESGIGQVAYLALTPQLFPFGPESLYPGRRRSELIRSCSLVLCISHAASRYIEQHIGLKAHVYHPPHFGSEPFPYFDNAETGSVLLMNASAVKGLPIFLDLAATFPDIPFAAIPGYATTARDREAITKLPNISLWPNEDDLNEIFRKTRVLLVPTLWMESFGLVVVDAMLRGIPVLASDHGALPEAKLGTPGLLPVTPVTRYSDQLDDNLLPSPVIPKQDARPWRDTLQALLSEPAVYREQSAMARAAALAFVRSLSLDSLEEVLKRPRTMSAAAGANSGRAEEHDLTLQQKALLAQRLRQTRSVAPALTIPVADRHSPIPLSSAQARLFFLDRLSPGTAVYNCPSAWRLHGILELPAMMQALNSLAARHEIMRTTFAVVNGSPRQIIADAVRIDMPVVDLSALPPESREAEAGRLLEEFASRPFNLATGPLTTAIVMRLADDSHIFGLNMHHIVTDGWSAGLLTRELFRLYDAFLAGSPQPSPPGRLQYADYSVWQQNLLSTPEMQNHAAFWKAALQGAPEVLELPGRKSRSRMPQHKGENRRFEMPAALAQAVQQLAAANDSTVFITLLAAFQALLHRISGQDDVIVGVPVANRVPPETETIAGFFVNTVPVRARFDAATDFTALLSQTREFCLNAWSHQALPFERIVEELMPQRRQSHAPVFQVLFSVVTDGIGLEARDLSISPIPIHSGTAKFDLNLEMAVSAGGITGSLEYDVDLFNTKAIDGILGSWRLLVEDIAANPRKRIAQLTLCAAEENAKILESYNPGRDTAINEMTVVELFRRQAERTPSAAALQFEGQCLTYREVDERSNRVAQYLCAHGVGPETIVGVSLRRSPELMIAVLGVLKAGGAYVPFDPEYPTGRVDYMLDATAPRVVITASEFKPRFADRCPTMLMLPDSERELLSFPAEPPPVHIAPESLGYVLFTSGSTGVPKGVQLPHRALANLIRWNMSVLPEPAKTLQFATINFDISFNEIFSTFATGGCLYVASEAEHRELGQLHRLLAKRGIEKVVLPAVLLNQLAQLQQDDPADLRSLRAILSTAEQLKITDAVRSLLESIPGASLYNDFGPTETHVCTSLFVSGRNDLWGPEPPIGRAIHNTRAYILDKYFNPVRPGWHGELFIAGDCLGRGYVRRPELTAERFLPDPFAPEAGACMYRTGDLVRLGEHGEIEYLGRIDRQVKIRGMRVEPGEVEAVIRQVPHVDDCLVMPVPDADGKPALAAWIAARAEPAVVAGAASEAIQAALPDYMMPAAMAVLSSFPLNPNGKIDRAALPKPDFENTSSPGADAPKTDIEARIAEIWSEVLRVERVGVRDDFFRLGGHSLLMIQVASRIRAAFGVEISLQSFFDGPTVEHLAVVVTEMLARERVGDADLDALLQEITDMPEDRVSSLLTESTTAAAGLLASATVKLGTGVGAIAGTAAAELGHFATEALVQPLVELHRHNQEKRAAQLRKSLLRQGRADAAPVPVAAIGFPSSNRAAALEPSIRSYVENLKKYGRRVELVVCSDPRDATVDREYREILQQVARDSGYPVAYAGLKEKRAFAARLASTAGVPLEDVQFALLDDSGRGRAYGTNRNALLLDQAGHAFLSVDDDTSARLYQTPGTMAGVEFCSEQDVSEIRVVPSRDEALQMARPEDSDLIGLHERILGMRVADLVSRLGADAPICCDRLNPELDAQVQFGSGRVLASYHGWLGDSGWASPEDARFLSGSSWQWLTRSEEAYNKALESREQLRFVRRLVLSRSGEFFIVAGGIDARQMPPPFVPNQRREDYLFGLLVRFCNADAFLAHLPAMVTHGAPNRQAWLGRDLVDLPTVLEASIARTSSAGDDRARLRNLGGYVEDIGNRGRDEFGEWMRSCVRPWVLAQLEAMERRAGECPPERSFWARDIRQITEISRHLLQRDDFWASRWTAGGSPGSIQTLLRRFGGLLKHWPALFEAARELRVRGFRLAQPVSSAI